MNPCATSAWAGLAILALCSIGDIAVCAANTVEVPFLIEAMESNDQVSNAVVMTWDHGSSPDPLEMRWETSQLPVRGTGLESLIQAFDYAMAHQSATRPLTGILSLSLTLSAILREEGPGFGAGLAVGFLAVLRGDQLARGVAITGTLESTGRIGKVKNIEQKILAAAYQGYRVVLVPREQLRVPHARLVGSGGKRNVIVREVGSIQEAYVILTGKQL
jgi:Lon-like protease